MDLSDMNATLMVKLVFCVQMSVWHCGVGWCVLREGPTQIGYMLSDQDHS